MSTMADLEQAERHVRQGRDHVASQERVVEELQGSGQLEDTAADLLEEFRATLEDHIAHRDRIKAELGLA